MSNSGSSSRRVGAQPTFVLSEDSTRTSGRDARQSNITAGTAIGEAVRTTLGPSGMDKLLVSDGSWVTTNDGATILKEMDIDHPAAEMIVEVAQTQEEEVGDGTTTATVLTGQLLSQAEDLFEDDVHPQTIVEGYHRACTLAYEAIDTCTLDVETNKDTLRKIATCSMNGKGYGTVTTERLASLVVDAVYRARDGTSVDRDRLAIQTHPGGSSLATELVNGLVVDESPYNVHLTEGWFKVPRILVLDTELGVRTGSMDVQYQVESADDLAAARAAEQEQLLEFADFIANETAIDTLFCTESVDDRIANELLRQNIVVYVDVSDENARLIANAVDATRLADLSDYDISEDYGQAHRLEIEEVDGEEYTMIKGMDAKETVTLLVRGGTRHAVAELERVVSDAVDAVVSAVETGEVVPGAGTTELAIADLVRTRAAGIDGRQQLAVEAFADAIDTIPRTLAETAGLDPIDALVELRARREESVFAGLVHSGTDVSVGDSVEAGILEPASVKRDAVRAATEAATMIVRIDDVISAD